MTVKHIAFTSYPVKDMARAKKFYEGALGLKEGGNFEGKWIEYYLDNGCFALTTMYEGTGSGIAFEVDDVDAVHQKLVAAGGKTIRDGFDTGGCRISVVADPDGNGVTLHKKNPGR
jgi:predicted enzyme related to lactoylglutathione lyase